MAERKEDLLRAVAVLSFLMSFAWLAAAYANWQWPENRMPPFFYGVPEEDVAWATVFFLIGAWVIVYRMWKQRQQDAFEKQEKGKGFVPRKRP